MALSLTVLGCSGSWPGPGGACSGYLVRSGSTAIWVDAGTGTFGNLRTHIGLDELTAVVLTHEHPDHWLELPVVRNALRYGSGREGLPVYGTAGVRTRAEAVIGGLAPTLAWRTVAGGDEVTIGGVEVRFAATAHPVETLAVGLEAEGSSLAYTADTGPAFDLGHLDPEGEGFDLALCEATLSEEQARTPAGQHHLSGGGAGRMAAAGGARRLLLTHIVPEGDPAERLAAARRAFHGPVDLAAQGATYAI